MKRQPLAAFFYLKIYQFSQSVENQKQLYQKKLFKVSFQTMIKKKAALGRLPFFLRNLSLCGY